MTQPTAPSLDTDEQLSGRAVDAVADMHGELQRRYTGLNTAEAQLAEALLTAHAASETGRARLQVIQQQLVEAISSPINALDTPAGERQFLIFLRSKVAEIQQVVDYGALTANDQTAVTNALANGYLSPDGQPALTPSDPPATNRSTLQPPTAPSAAPMASMPPALSGLPSSPPAPPGAGGLSGMASPLSGLASLLAGDHLVPRADDTGVDTADEDGRPGTGKYDPAQGEPKDEHRHDGPGDDDPGDDDSDHDDDARSAEPEDAPPDDVGPAETRPADR